MKSDQGSLAWENLSFPLENWLQEGIKSLGFATMTPVQASTIPLFLGNKDVVVEAVTGSGKTLAFVIPILQRLSRRICPSFREFGEEEGEDDDDNDDDGSGRLKKGHMFAIVLSPTRELARQIQQVIERFLEYYPEGREPIGTQLLVGSLSTVRQDIDSFLTKRPQILVGTPGRLADFVSSSHVKCSSTEVLVLDEADKLLDFLLEKDVISIIKKLPKQRRTGLFSATIASANDKIFRTGMTNPVKVSVKSKNGRSNAPTSLNISYMFVEPRAKLLSLLKLVQGHEFKKCIVYLPTCTSVKYFYGALYALVGKLTFLKFYSIHGQLATKPRLKTLQDFADASNLDTKYVLLTTDVAARGIDVPDVDLVIQLDPPTDPDFFLHRCGRTGRANKVGHAIVMLNRYSRESAYVDFMKVKNVEMVEMEAPDVTSSEFCTHEIKFRNYVLEDRARHELAVRSYVAFVRYYSKHLAASIFRLESLDYLGIARAYGLLRLPKMPETKYIAPDAMPEGGWLGEPIDMDAYRFKDESKEKSRLENLESEKLKKELDAKRRKHLKVKNEAWSEKTEHKETKQDRREKIKRKREAIEKQIMDQSSDEDETMEDWKEIVKKNKKHKQRQNQNSNGMHGDFEGL